MKKPSLSIDLATSTDAAAVREIYAPHVEHGVTSFEFAVPTTHEIAERIDRTLVRHPWLVGRSEGALAGYAYAGPHRVRGAYQWSCEVSVYVHPAHQGHGFGGALYRTLFEVLRLQGFVNAYAGISLPNPASVTLHERLGFEPVGVYRRIGFKHGTWHDVGWWELRLSEPDGAPAAPNDLSELDPDSVRALLR